MDVSDFDFDLPDELIAQDPPVERGTSRLLVLDRASGAIEDCSFTHVAAFLAPGDVLVVNNTRVFPARLLGRRVPTGGAVEAMLLGRQTLPGAGAPGGDLLFPHAEPPRDNVTGAGVVAPVDARTPANAAPTTFVTPATGVTPAGAVTRATAMPPADAATAGDAVERRAETPEDWDALMHPGQKLKPGARVLFERDGVELHGEVLARHFHGRRTLRLWREDGGSVMDAIERIGHIPLPPYIKRDETPSDRLRYQTVYARERGSVAAPTAGLHFTPAILDEVAARGVERIEITLHVGYGTFKPVRVETVEDHVVDPETFAISADAAQALTRARRENRRIIAVGTTTTRALESLAIDERGAIEHGAGTARIFIHPGYRFRIVNGLITNFHLPRSSLLMLVAAFAGRERVLAAYRHAVAAGYRFYSYGDAMLIR